MKILLLIPLLVIGMLFILGLLSQRGETPGLNDDGRLKAVGAKPNAVCSETGTDEPFRVDPLPGTKAQMKTAIKALGGTITSETDSYISATFASRIFRFIDDVELRQDPAQPGLWHVRSASRVGHSDMGANRKRVQQLREKLQSPAPADA